MIRTLLIALSLTGAAVQAETFRLAATTSFNNSGLSDVLLPAIAQDIGLDVQLLVVGTGQAIRLGQSGDVDAILRTFQIRRAGLCGCGLRQPQARNHV